MEKEFVPYKLAVKLKELGFDEPCMASRDMNNDENLIQIPLYQQAFRWFREKYGLYTEMHKKFDGIGVSIILSEYRYDMRQDKEVEYHIPKYFGNIYRSYEEAELACLEKLIEIIESKSE
jgi:hypothetical protein